VPKYEIKHRAGNAVPSDLREILLKFFKESEVVKLERLGGRVMISLAAPYVSKEQRNRSDTKIDEAFISKLRELRNDDVQLEKQLALLSVKQLRELGKYLENPLRTKSARQELIAELATHFQSEDIWKRISEAYPLHHSELHETRK
jgi:hypothetical protein